MTGITAMFDGDRELAASSIRRAANRARNDGDHAQLAWTLALLAMFESTHEPEHALPMAEEALAVARRIGGSVITLYPLVAVISAATNTEPALDPARALEAAEECVRSRPHATTDVLEHRPITHRKSPCDTRRDRRGSHRLASGPPLL